MKILTDLRGENKKYTEKWILKFCFCYSFWESVKLVRQIVILYGKSLQVASPEKFCPDKEKKEAKGHANETKYPIS